MSSMPRSDKDQFSSIRLLDRFYGIFLLVCIFFLTVGVPFVFYRKLMTAFIVVVMTVVVLVAWRMSRRGQPEKSLKLFSAFLLVVIVGLLYGGLPPVTMATTLAVSVMLAVVVHLRAGIIFGALYLTAWLVNIVLQMKGWAPAPYFTGGPWTGWLIGMAAVWLVLLPIPELVGRLRRAASLHHAVIEAASDAILVINTQGKVETYNQNFVTMWGIPSDILHAHDDSHLLDLAVRQLVAPEPFLQKMTTLAQRPDLVSFDTVLFQDGRVVECQSKPQRLDGHIVGRVWSFSDVTERALTQEALRKSKEQIEAILYATNESIFLLDRQGVILSINDTAARRIQADPLALVGQCVFAYFSPDVAAVRRAALDEVFATGQVKSMEDARADQFFALNFYPVHDDTGVVKSVVVFALDVTERKRAEQAALTLAKRNQILMQTATDGIHILDSAGHLVECNDAFARMLGYDAQEITRCHVSQWDAKLNLEQLQLGMPDMLKFGGAFETLHRRKDGSLLDVEVHANGVHIDGQTYLYASSRDITVRKQVQAEVLQLAFHDSLTQLPNRRLFNDRLEQTLVACRRSGRLGAMLFLDLDKFKPLNDAHGHGVGDLLLVEVARRLAACVREMDTIARFGGDEFVVMLGKLDTDSLAAQGYASRIAEKIRDALAQPYILHVAQAAGSDTDVHHRCTCSIGIAMFGAHATHADVVINQADSAMYQAKEAGGNTFSFYAVAPT